MLAFGACHTNQPFVNLSDDFMRAALNEDIATATSIFVRTGLTSDEAAATFAKVCFFTHLDVHFCGLPSHIAHLVKVILLRDRGFPTERSC